MADFELALCGGEKTFNLKFDTSEDVLKAVLKSSVMEESQPRPIWHQADGEDGNELVDMTYDDGRMALAVVMEATTWPELLAEVAALRRVVEQAHAHARGEAWADEVYIRGRPDSSLCPYTYYTVKMVEDRSGGWLSGVQIANVMIDEIAFTATVAAAGYGDEEALANELINGHMLVESVASGLAWGLNAYLTPTFSLDTETCLIGGKSQKVVTDSSSFHGFYTETVTLAEDGYAKASLWAPLPAGDPVTFTLYQGTIDGNEFASVTLESANSVDSVLKDGVTWYKFVISGSNEDFANVTVRVYRDSEDATQETTFYIDGLYLEISTEEMPATRSAWADYPILYNRNDAGENLVENGTMELDSNWASVGSPPENERTDEQAPPQGTYSRKFTVDAVNEGIQSDDYGTVTGATYPVSLYVYPDDGTRCRVKIRKGDDSGFVYDAAQTGLVQDTFNEISFEYTETAGGPGAYIIIEGDTETAATFYVDYVRVLNPCEFRDHVDVWGIPGDQPAWLGLKATVAVDLDGVVAYLSKAYLANYLEELSGGHCYDIGAESGVSEQSDGSCNGGDYQQDTISGYFDIEPGLARDNYLMLVRVRSDDSGDPTFQVSCSRDGRISYTYLDEIEISNTDRWLLLTAGIVNARVSELFDEAGGEFVIRFYSDGTALSHIDYDCVRFLPYGAFMIIPFPSLLLYDSTSHWFEVDGRKREIVQKGSVYADDTGLELGGMWTLMPSRMNRLVLFIVHEAVNNLNAESDTCRTDFGWDLELSYRPRTRGWLA